jgi:hypothetical protein
VTEDRTYRPKSRWDIDNMGQKREYNENGNLKNATSGVQRKTRKSNPRPARVPVRCFACTLL